MGRYCRHMDTVDGTGAPLEPHSGEGRPSPPAEPGGGDPAIPKEKLAEADRHLRTIGDEVAALREELARLREEASERAELLVEREVIIAELSGLLPTLEEARVEALRRAEDASAVLVRTEARLSEQAAQVTELHGQLATVGADTAARERLLADLEARLAEERAERENERADARRQAEEGAAAARLSESRLVQEKKRVETLEQELETLEAALARRVAGLSELEATVSQVRSEHEEVATATAIATDRPYLPAGSPSLGHLRFVLRAGSYTVSPSDGEPPEPGQRVEVDGERFFVAKIGRSPFPSDPRPCAYLLVEAEPNVPG